MTMTTTKAPHLLVLSVGGLQLALDIAALPPAARRGLLAAYAPFLLPAASGGGPPAADPAVHLKLELHVAEGPCFMAPVPGQAWRIDTCDKGGRLHYTSYHERGWLDLAACRGRLELRPGAQPENFLRLAVARLALAHGGLLLHAGGLIRRAGGYIFFGHSGAGKSTVASFAPAGSTLLSDDLVLLRLHAAPPGEQHGGWLGGQHGEQPAAGLGAGPGLQLWLHGVPFAGEALPPPRPNASAPVAGLYALRQAPSHALIPLPAPLAVAHLLACVPFIDGDADACQQALAICIAIARAMPIHTLAFARDPNFWPLITGKEARSHDHHA